MHPYNVGYTAANFNPGYGSMVPASVALGIGACLLWVSQGAMLTALAEAHARETGASPSKAIASFNAVFWTGFQVGAWGGLRHPRRLRRIDLRAHEGVLNVTRATQRGIICPRL